MIKAKRQKKEFKVKQRNAKKSEEWRRDSKKEKSLLERSVQNTSVKEKH